MQLPPPIFTLRPKACLRTVTTAIATICLSVSAAAATPDTFQWSGRALAQAKQEWQNNNPAVGSDIRFIINEAEPELKREPITIVTAEKQKNLPPSGSPNDYYSTAPYWWPNPATENGLPYVRRDGQRNPNYFGGDPLAMSNLITAVRRLALAWYFTEDQRYADQATLLLKTWFLDPQTKMNPHMRYAQAIPGVNEGRSIGMIDTARLLELIDSIQLLKDSQGLSQSDYEGIQAWFSDFLTWCLQSEFGNELAGAENNIGTWYYAQIGTYAAISNRLPEIIPLYKKNLPALLDTQILADGRQPEELARTRAMSYSAYNLQAWQSIAALGERMGLGYQTNGNPVWERIRNGLRYLAPYASAASDWPHRELDVTPPRNQLTPVFLSFLAAANEDADPLIESTSAQLKRDFPTRAWVRLVYGSTK